MPFEYVFPIIIICFLLFVNIKICNGLKFISYFLQLLYDLINTFVFASITFMIFGLMMLFYLMSNYIFMILPLILTTPNLPTVNTFC